MGANLDPAQQHLIFTVTTCVTMVILSFVAYAQALVFPRLRKLQLQQQQQQQQHDIATNKNITNDEDEDDHEDAKKKSTGQRMYGYSDYLDIDSILVGCLQSFCLMALTTALCCSPITIVSWYPNTYSKEDATQRLTSSINFCEADFLYSRYIAEPVNTISSVIAYIPLALIGISLHHCQRQQPDTVRVNEIMARTRYLVSYIAICMIGVGSTLLHTFLTATMQGGDELPMLWYSASISYCALDLILRPMGVQGVGTFIVVTTITSTVVYVQHRADFTVFYIIFSTYCVSLILSLIHISLFMDWESIRPNGVKFKERVILPLARACGFLVVAAIWIWVTEMLGCAYAQEQGRGTITWQIWNNMLHPIWHFLTGIVAFLLVQFFYAAQGFVNGRGMPHIVWNGAPLIIFPDKRQTLKKME